MTRRAGPSATLLADARSLLATREPQAPGLWPRAVAHLTRQALEELLDALWRVRAPGVADASTHAQLICLPSYIPDRELAGRVAYAWGALSAACHRRAYDLAPAHSELESWLGIAEAFAEVVQRAAARRTQA